jgi:hypothetical protein
MKVLGFTDFLVEGAEEEGAKLKHITHAEDRPLFHGAEGFHHAYDNALCIRFKPFFDRIEM